MYHLAPQQTSLNEKSEIKGFPMQLNAPFVLVYVQVKRLLVKAA